MVTIPQTKKKRDAVMFPLCAPVTRGLYSVAASIGLYSAQTVFVYKQLQRVVLLATHLSSPNSPSLLSLSFSHTHTHTLHLHTYTHCIYTQTPHIQIYNTFTYTYLYIHTITYTPYTLIYHNTVYTYTLKYTPHIQNTHIYEHMCAHTHGKPLFEIFGRQ